MTSIFKPKSSPYYYIKIKLPNGKWVSKSTGTKDKKIAELILRKEEWSMWNDEDTVTVQEITDKFLTYQEKRISIAYWHNLKSRLNDFTGWLIKRRIDDIREIEYFHVEDYLQFRSKVDKSGTINQKLTQIKQLLRFAIDRDYIDRNPASRVKPHKHKTAPPYYFSEGDIKKILTNAGKYRNFYIIVLHTGLRARDACTLKWSEVNLKTRRLKRITGKRGVVVNQHINNTEMKAFKELRNDSDFVFPELIEKKQQDNAQKHLRKLFDRDKIGLHTLRHTCASFLISAGASLYEVSRHLGHSSITTTQVYAHLKQDRLKKVSSLLD